MEQYTTGFQLTRTAPPPFDGHDYDLILRSSDAVDFRLHKRVLSRVSETFEALINGANDHDFNFTGSLVLHVPEASDTLYGLLQHCYAIPQKTLDTTICQLEAAQRYGVADELAVVRHTLFDFAAKEPERTFAVACRFRFPEVAVRAAQMCHRRSESDNRSFVEEMKDLSAGAYFRLRRFRKGLEAPPRELVAIATTTKSNTYTTDYGPGYAFAISQSRSLQLVPDVQIVTTDGNTLQCHSCFLAMASPALADRVSAVKVSSGGLSTIQLEEDHSATGRLLELVYHCGHPTVNDLNDLKLFVPLVVKYNIYDGMNYLRKQCMQLLEVKTDPMRVYFVAVKYKWYDEARAIAKILVQTSHAQLSDIYTPEMEDVSALAYHRLLQYADECEKVASVAVNHFKSLREKARIVNDYSTDFAKRMNFAKETCAHSDTIFLGVSPFDEINAAFLNDEFTMPDAKLVKWPVTRLVFGSKRVRDAIEAGISEVRLELEDVPELTQATLRPLPFLYNLSELTHNAQSVEPPRVKEDVPEELEAYQFTDAFEEQMLEDEAETPAEVEQNSPAGRSGAEHEHEDDDAQSSGQSSCDDLYGEERPALLTDEEYDGMSESSSNQEASDESDWVSESEVLNEPLEHQIPGALRVVSRRSL